MATQLIIKGAIYKSGDTLLRPHYSGEFFMVDCTEFKTKKEIKENYDKRTAKQFLENYPLECDGVKYYQCEYSPWHVDNFQLLSDISSLEFNEEETEF